MAGKVEIHTTLDQSALQPCPFPARMRETPRVYIDAAGRAQVDEGPVVGDFIGQFVLDGTAWPPLAVEHPVATLDGHVERRIASHRLGFSVGEDGREKFDVHGHAPMICAPSDRA